MDVARRAHDDPGRARALTLAGQIRALRQATGLSRAAFAARLGCSRVSVYRWELGIVPPSKLAQESLDAFAATALAPREVR